MARTAKAIESPFMPPEEELPGPPERLWPPKSNTDLIYEVKAWLPGEAKPETFTLRVRNARGSVPAARNNRETVMSAALSGLASIYGNKASVE